MKYCVALSGSYNGGRIEDLFKDLSMDGILHMSLIGREVTLQVSNEHLDDVKKRLSLLGIDNVSVLEWKKAGVTVSEPGLGEDKDHSVKVSLIPSVKGGGINQLAVLSEVEIKEGLEEELSRTVEEILEDAGVTDAIYTIHLLKKEKDYLDSISKATLNALFDSGGVVNLD